jgi:hypothetical protein
MENAIMTSSVFCGSKTECGVKGRTTEAQVRRMKQTNQASDGYGGSVQGKNASINPRQAGEVLVRYMGIVVRSVVG